MGEMHDRRRMRDWLLRSDAMTAQWSRATAVPRDRIWHDDGIIANRSVRPLAVHP